MLIEWICSVSSGNTSVQVMCDFVSGQRMPTMLCMNCQITSRCRPVARRRKTCYPTRCCLAFQKSTLVLS